MKKNECGIALTIRLYLDLDGKDVQLHIQYVYTALWPVFFTHQNIAMHVLPLFFMVKDANSSKTLLKSTFWATYLYVF